MRGLKVFSIPAILALAFFACGDDETTTGPGPPNPQSPWDVAFKFYHGETEPDAGFRDFDFAGPNDGWACALDRVFHYDGSRWRLHTNLGEKYGYPISLQAISAPAPNDVWVGGLIDKDGVDLFHYDGSSWTPVDTGIYRPRERFVAFDIFFIAPNRGWVGTYFYTHWPVRGDILYYDGSSWTLQGCGASVIGEMYFSGPNDGWAIGDDGEYRPSLFRWDGTYWDNVRLPQSGNVYYLASLDFCGPDEGWVFGSEDAGPVLYHYAGGSWHKTTPPAADNGDCTLLSSANGWLAEKGRRSWFYDGLDFKGYPLPWADVGSLVLFGVSENDVWAGTGNLGGYSYILHFTGFK